jgi:hypothetical protein
VGRLHGGNDAERGKARDVLTGKDLSMFDSQTSVASRRRGLERACVSIEHHAVGAIADGVGRKLESLLKRAARQLVHLSLGRSDHSGSFRSIAVGREQGGTA